MRNYLNRALIFCFSIIFLVGNLPAQQNRRPRTLEALKLAIESSGKNAVVQRKPGHDNGAIVGTPLDPATISGNISGVTTDSLFAVEIYALQRADSGRAEFIYPGIVFPDFSFQIDNLPAGEFVVIAYVQGYIPEFYGETIDRDSAKVISAAAGDWITGIEITLESFPQTAASISGKIIEDETATPIDSAWVMAIVDQNPFLILQTVSDAQGDFTINNLLPAKYILQAGEENHVAEFYQDSEAIDSATRLKIADSTKISNIIISLAPAVSISGTITADDGNPLPQVMVFAIPAEDSDMTYPGVADVSGPDGKYRLGNLNPGQYFVKAVFMDGQGYQEKWWSGDSVSGERTIISVDKGAQIGGIDFIFSPQKLDGQIEGYVTDAGGNPLFGSQVYLEFDYGRYDSSGSGLDLIWPGLNFSTSTDENGFFQFLQIPYGNYVASASYALQGQYVTVWWDSAASRRDADVISITDTTDFPVKIGFSLPVKNYNSSISGFVYSDDGRPLQNAWINVQPAEIHRCRGRMDPTGRCSGQTWGWAQSDSSGFYRVDLLAPDDYLVHVQYWEDISFAEMWFDNAESREAATVVTLPDNFEHENTNFKLPLRPIFGNISGQVFEKVSGVPITRALVELTPVWPDKIMAPIRFWNYTTTVDDSGRFEFSWLPEGDYLVSVYADGAFAYYKNAPVALLADSIHVTGGEERNIEFRLAVRHDGPGEISGQILSEESGFPLKLGVVIARPAVTVLQWPESELFYTAVSSEGGRYTLRGLPDGEFLLMAFADNFIPEYFDNTYDPAQAKMITIKDGVAVGGINFQLSPMLFLRSDGLGQPMVGGIGEIRGAVLNETGAPIAGAQVFLYDENNEVVSAARTNAAGQYIFSGLQNGNYRLQASHFGNRSRYNNDSENLNNAPVIFLAGEVSGIDFHLPGSTATGVGEQEKEFSPQGLQLLGNYPNPFNPQTRIKFSLSESQSVQVKIYNLLGREIAIIFDGKLPAGEHAITWNAQDAQDWQLGTGLYFYRVFAGSQVKTGKMILQK